MSLGPITHDLENDAGGIPFNAPVEDSVVRAEEEEQRQRAAMEHQVHAQSSAIDATATHSEHNVSGAAPTLAPEQERVRGERLTEAELLVYRGKLLVDAEGGEIGPISRVYLDEATAIPKWLGAQVGSLMGSQCVVAPVFGSYVFAERISVPYARTLILGAEVAATGGIPQEQDSRLYLHYGIPVSNDRSAAGLPAGLDRQRERSLEGILVPLARDVRQAGGHAWDIISKWRWPWTRAA